MPNQLSSTKNRKSMTEHKAVLAMLERIAQIEGTTTMALIREAVREAVKKRIKDSSRKNWMWPLVMRFAPSPPNKFLSPAHLSRFKRNQREFDQMLLDLHLTTPDCMESRNSIVSPKCKIRVLELERRNANP